MNTIMRRYAKSTYHFGQDIAKLFNSYTFFPSLNLLNVCNLTSIKWWNIQWKKNDTVLQKHSALISACVKYGVAMSKEPFLLSFMHFVCFLDERVARVSDHLNRDMPWSWAAEHQATTSLSRSSRPAKKRPSKMLETYHESSLVKTDSCNLSFMYFYVICADIADMWYEDIMSVVSQVIDQWSSN